MKSSNRLRYGWFVLIVVVALLVACAPIQSGTAPAAEDAPAAAGAPIRIGYSTWVGYGAFFVALEKGMFDDAGVTVEMVKVEDPKLRFAALAAGELEGVVTTLDTMTLYVKPDFQLATVIALDDSKGGDGIVAKQEIATVADLAGRKVAFNSGSVSDFYLNYVLQEAGLSVEDVEAVNMQQDDAGAAFVAGQVDAAVTWEPWLSRAKAAPDGKVLVDSSANPGLIVDILLFRKDVIEARQADVQKVVGAYWQAVEYVKSNPDESIEIMARNVGGWLEDPQAFAATLTGVQLYDQAMNQAFFADPDAPGFQTAQFAIDLWTAQGRISDPLTAADIIDNSFVGE